jgi:hypothetical protein
MASLRIVLSLCLAAGLTLWLAGCTSGTATTTPATPEGDGHGHDHDGADHDHGHDHSHAHGPHDGHIVEIGEEEYHAEYTHDGQGKITVYVLDKDLKKEVPIAAEKIVIETKIGKATNSFELMAVNPTEGDMPMASQFEITDVQLEEVLKIVDGKGVTATLKLTIDGQPYEAPIAPDEHKH